MTTFNEKVFNTILRLEVSKGHLRWTLSDVARFAEVSRPLIYHHLGKDKEELLHMAWKSMLQTMFSLNQTEELGIQKRIEEVVGKINSSPYLFVLFFLEKNAESEIGQMIRDAEQTLFKFLKKKYPRMSEDDILKVYLLELGAVAYRPRDMASISFLFPK